MKFHAVLLIVGIFALSGCDRAQDFINQKQPKIVPDPICQELDATIDEGIKNIALSLAQSDVYDKGAAQQAARFLAANNYFQVIHISLALQSQHKCPIRKSVINPMMYNKDATECFFATLGQKRDEISKLCDFKNWKGNNIHLQNLPPE